MNVKDIDLNIGEDFGIVYAVQDDNVDLTWIQVGIRHTKASKWSACY